jgi:hypothetical protein
MPLSYALDFITARGNLRDSLTYLDTIWSGMSTSDKYSWYLQAYNILDLTGYYAFLQWFGLTFAQVQSNMIRYVTISLIGGISWNYVDRASWSWSVA